MFGSSHNRHVFSRAGPLFGVFGLAACLLFALPLALSGQEPGAGAHAAVQVSAHVVPVEGLQEAVELVRTLQEELNEAAARDALPAPRAEGSVHARVEQEGPRRVVIVAHLGS